MIILPQLRGALSARRVGSGGGGSPGGSPTSNDPYFATVVNLTHFDDGGSPSPSTFENAAAHGIGLSRRNDVPSTTESVFGGSAMRRVNDDACAFASHADWQFGTNDFTVEFWFRPDAVDLKSIFDMRANVAGQIGLVIYIEATGQIKLWANLADRITSSTGIIVANTWAAIAVSRVSGTTRMFVDGVQVGSDYTDANDYNQTAWIYLGSFSDVKRNAYYDELRVSNGLYGSGAGRYSGNYTVATAAFPDS